MEKKITDDELSNIRRIMRDFSFVHHRISEISSEINNLNKKSEELVTNLEKIRKEESDFLGILSEKYGSGVLDPFKMVYITQESDE